MTHIRWGILGASKFAREHMGPAINAAKGAVLSAVASRNPASVGPFQEFAAECRAILVLPTQRVEVGKKGLYTSFFNTDVNNRDKCASRKHYVER